MTKAKPHTPAPVDTAKGGESSDMCLTSADPAGAPSAIEDARQLKHNLQDLDFLEDLTPNEQQALVVARAYIKAHEALDAIPAIIEAGFKEWKKDESLRDMLDDICANIAVLTNGAEVDTAEVDTAEVRHPSPPQSHRAIPSPGREEVIEECIQAVENVFFAMARPDVHLMNFIREHLRALKAPSP